MCVHEGVCVRMCVYVDTEGVIEEVFPKAESREGAGRGEARGGAVLPHPVVCMCVCMCVVSSCLCFLEASCVLYAWTSVFVRARVCVCASGCG